MASFITAFKKTAGPQSADELNAVATSSFRGNPAPKCGEDVINIKKSPKIIFEDKDMLVLEKPAGIIVNRAETVFQPTIEDWVKKYLGIRGAGVGGRSGVVHRLDKETSGILLVAKNQEVFADLQGQFKRREVAKEYLALVHGMVIPSTGKIEVPISRNPHDREKFTVRLGGRQAGTEYEAISYFGKDYTLLKVHPKTGRTHQIRVHLKYIGHPVVGDEKYAGRKISKRDRAWCSRQFLHAHRLIFLHPITKEKLNFVSPLPEDLAKILKKISLPESS